jgi:ERCC4-related helicase
MTAWHPFAESIQLAGYDRENDDSRIKKEDAARQTGTAQEILRRLGNQPGIVLADEVGMGKTFVALAVGTSVALSDKRRRPVVVMVPPSLKKKWPRDFDFFRQKCLEPDAASRIRAASAETAVEFLRLLDDPLNRRNSIIFLTHGAMHRGLTDGWVKLAMIQRALYRRHHTQSLRRSLSRCLGKLLQMGWAEQRSEGILNRLLDLPPSDWMATLRKHDMDELDDPVPQAVVDVLRDYDTSEVYAALQDIPQKKTASWNDRVIRARRVLTEMLKGVWGECLTQLRFKLPLLIMDEAHHLKNADTQLAKLFRTAESQSDADEISRGALGAVFERMLFLTATPFQLGHHELCSVLERFGGIAWKSAGAPKSGHEEFASRVNELHEQLDTAQCAALNLDAEWGKLRDDDLVVNDKRFDNVESWWTSAMQADATRTLATDRVLAAYQTTSQKMRAAGELLRPWVIRHLKPRKLDNGRLRREALPGAAIIDDLATTKGDAGLEVSDAALLPFLLAARATVYAPDSRPVFAEGLASSYEAFLHTRKANDSRRNLARTNTTDGDDDAAASEMHDDAGRWYLIQIEKALQRHGNHASTAHPKIAATARRVLAAWERGEKVVVFCHYIATGKVLRQVISSMLHDEIVRRGAAKLDCKESEVESQLENLGRRFFQEASSVRQACDAEVGALLDSFPTLAPHREVIADIVRRFLRTPSFLVRYFPLSEERLDGAAVSTAFDTPDSSNLNLRTVVNGLFKFLATQCGDKERQECLDAIGSVQTGERVSVTDFSDDELQGADVARLLPNVRLVNGATRQETRQRLMLTFNSPFFPEVLVASSVMAEGVDLHRFCRYVIHHDLCWNPSTLEQRTGRIDRIGAKVEQCGEPIRMYLPYLAETQDEKMYRVVMDRERWFSVVMGEQFKVDTRSTERLAERVPLPASLAQELAFRLESSRDGWK